MTDSLLKQALDAVAPGAVSAEDVAAVEQWLRERDAFVRVDYARVWKREEQALKKAERQAQEVRYAAMPRYTGAIALCQAIRTQPRGAPYRCGGKATRITRDRIDGRPMVVCTACAHYRNPNSRYRGWGGDPNPKMEVPEQEFIDLLNATDPT